MNGHQRIWRGVAFAGILTLVAGACTTAPAGESPAPTTAATAAPTAEQPVKGGRVVEGTFSDIKTMNPILSSDNASGRISDLLYDGLITQDAKNGEPRPAMATFSVSKDGLTYSFVIDAKAVWSDGKPVIAEDFLVAKKLVAKSKVSTRKSLFKDIKGFDAYVKGEAKEIEGIKIDAADPKKFTITLTGVSCDAITQATNYVLPAHVWGKYATESSKDEVDKAPENTNPTVVSGPFKFKEWRQGDQVILTRNDTYWKGAPLVDEYVYKVVADATVLAAQLKTGELNFGSIEPKDLADIETQDSLRVTKVDALGYTYIGWRTNSTSAPALQDKRVRQALAYGLNMADVTTAILFGQGSQHVAHHIPVQWAYPDPKLLNQYAYDPKKAEDLLQQAGYKKNASGIYEKDGKPISFTIRTNAGNKTRETLAQIASEQYKKIGIDAKTSFEQFQGLVDKLTSGDPSIEAVIIGWINLGNDPYQLWHSSQTPNLETKQTGLNFTFFKSAEVDKAIEQARNPSDGDCSIATRKKNYETFDKILNDEQPYNFGFIQKALFVTNKSLQSFDPGSYGTIYNVEKWWFKK